LNLLKKSNKWRNWKESIFGNYRHNPLQLSHRTRKLKSEIIVTIVTKQSLVTYSKMFHELPVITVIVMDNGIQPSSYYVCSLYLKYGGTYFKTVGFSTR
jgi:hypothetical protein